MLCPKVLIISHNIIGLTSNMGKTLHTYFENWPKDKLCQLFFHSEVPTTHLCEEYFRISDFDNVNALLRFRKPGTVLTAKDIEEYRKSTRIDSGKQAQIYQKGRSRKPWMYIARNALWSLGLWKTKKLDAWIRQCKPDVIFFASGDYTFAYKVALYISKKYNIPLTTSVYDDYYFQRPGGGLLAKWNTLRFRKTMEKTMAHSTGCFYLHPIMEKMYGEKFPNRNGLLYTTAPLCQTAEPEGAPLRISYFGGLSLQRDTALMEIGKAVKKLIPDGSVLVDVYSAETQQEVLANIVPENGLRFCGMLSAEEVAKAEEQSNILLFVESCAPSLLERLRCSLSTKVGEYLAANRCILAYGPEEAGSIRYFLDCGVGCVITETAQLEETLQEILFSAESRAKYAKKQLQLAEKNHLPGRNHAVLLDVFQQATN